MSEPRICPMCNGAKSQHRYDGDERYSFDCPACSGTGIVEPLRIPIRPGVVLAPTQRDVSWPLMVFR